MEARHRIDQPALRRAGFQEIMRRQRLQHGAQLRRSVPAFSNQSGLSRFSSSVRSSSLTGTSSACFTPLHEARHRRQRDEGVELGQFAPQFLDHLLDQEAAEGNAAKSSLGIRDRIEHARCARARSAPAARSAASSGAIAVGIVSVSATSTKISGSSVELRDGRRRSSGGRPGRYGGANRSSRGFHAPPRNG